MSNRPKRSEDSTPLYSKNSGQITPFETIRRPNPAGNEFWSSRDFARVLGYVNYRHFQAVIAKARTACFNSGQRVEDHFVGIDEMVEIGSGAQRAIPTVMMSRYVLLISRSRSSEAFAFYHTETLRGGWSARQLQRHMGSQFYERTALSRNKAAMLAKGAKPKPGDAVSADEEICHPLVLEFLGLRDEYSETGLQAALVRHLETSCWNSATISPSWHASAGCALTTNGIAWTSSFSTAPALPRDL